MSQDTTANLSIVANVEGTDRAASELDRVAAAGARAEAGATKAAEALKGVGAAGNSAGSGLGSAASGASSAASGLSSVAATAGAAALGIGATVAAVGALANSLIPVELAAQKLQKTLDFTNNGNAAAAAKELDYLRNASNRLGLEFNSTASAYVKFAAAAKGTAIEGDAAKRVFEGISKASVVLGLSADETSGALNALQQMVSKGTVQAEELRGQLGERLPGAFQIAARAMGVSTAELGKLLEQGKVTAEDMLPKLAAELEKTFGDSAKKAADDLQGQLNRMQNSWTEFKQVMSKAVLPLTVSVTAVAADALNSGNVVAKLAKERGYGPAASAFLGLGGSVLGAFGVETDPRQVRENKLSDLYSRQQGITSQLNDPTRAMYWGMLKGENDKIQAEIDKLESAKRTAFELKRWAADAARETKALAEKTSGESEDRIAAKRKAQHAEFDKRGEPLRTNAEKLKEALEVEKKVLDDGIITISEYNERKKRLEEKYKDKPKVDKDAQDAKREAERQQERLNGLLEVGSGVSKTYTADVTLLGKALASGKITTEEYSAAASKLWKTQTESGKAWEASADAAEKANKALNVWKAEHESQLASITEETSAVGQNAAARKVALAGLQVEADARKRIEQLSLNLSETDRAAAVVSINAERDKQKALVETALRKQQAVEGAYQLEQENRRFAAESILDEKQRAQVILDIDAETWRQRIDLAEVGSEERRRLEGAFAQWYSNQLSKPAIESMRKALESIDQTFHDSFTRMLENGKADWDAFGKALATSFKTAVADEIYKLTIKPIVVSVVSSFAGGAAQAAGSVSGQSGSGIGGVVQGVQSAYGAYNSGISNAATAFATSGVGQYMGLSTAGQAMGPPTAAGAMGYTSSGATMTSSGSTAVSSAGWVGAIIAAIYSGLEWNKRGWFNDNSLPGLDREFREVFRRGAGKYDRLFGHNRFTNADASGIVGTFDLSGFSGNMYQDYSRKGGTFRSDERWTDPYAINSDLDKFLNSALKQTVSGLQTIGKTLNIETVKAMEGFSHEFKLQLSDNGDMSKAGEKIAAELGKVSDELVKRLVPTIGEFSQFGESATQTFQRLNQEVQATDAILLAMGKDASEAFGGVGLASIAAREDLIALAGGIDALASKTQSFYQHFYSSDEQLKLAAKQAQKVLDAGFAELSIPQPADKKGFRDLVEKYGSDLSTESARKFFNSLLDLEDEFYAVSAASDATAEKLKQSTDAAKASQGSIFDTFASDAQKLDAAKKIVNDAFSSIGRSVPDSAASFLELSQSLVPTDKASQDLINTLAKVSNAFAYVQTAAATAAQVAKDAAATAAQVAKDAAETARQTALNNANAAARGYFANLDALSNAASLANDGQAAIDRMFGAVEDGALNTAQMAADAAANAAQAWKSASQSIKSALDNIRTGSLSGLSPEARYRLLQSQFSATSASAQSGDSEAAGKLGQIATDFLDASRDYNASSEAFQRDRAAADTALDKSLSYAQAQASLQDTIAKASSDAVTQLQTLNTSLTGFAGKALELLQKSYGGADRATATGAVKSLADIQAMADQWFANAQSGFSMSYAGGTLTRLNDNYAQFEKDGTAWALRAGESALDLAKRIEAFRTQWSGDFGINLPSYAVGTAYVPEDQIAQVHKGEMIIPASAAEQLRKYGVSNQPDNSLQAEMLAELRANRQALQSGNVALQQQLAASNAKLAAVEKRLAAIEDGNRLTRASL